MLSVQPIHDISLANSWYQFTQIMISV